MWGNLAVWCKDEKRWKSGSMVSDVSDYNPLTLIRDIWEGYTYMYNPLCQTIYGLSWDIPAVSMAFKRIEPKKTDDRKTTRLENLQPNL